MLPLAGTAAVVRISSALSGVAQLERLFDTYIRAAAVPANSSDGDVDGADDTVHELHGAGSAGAGGGGGGGGEVLGLMPAPEVQLQGAAQLHKKGGGLQRTHGSSSSRKRAAPKRRQQGGQAAPKKRK